MRGECALRLCGQSKDKWMDMAHGIGPERSTTERLDHDDFEARRKFPARAWMDVRSGTAKRDREMVTVSKDEDGTQLPLPFGTQRNWPQSFQCSMPMTERKEKYCCVRLLLTTKGLTLTEIMKLWILIWNYGRVVIFKKCWFWSHSCLLNIPRKCLNWYGGTWTRMHSAKWIG